MLRAGRLAPPVFPRRPDASRNGDPGRGAQALALAEPALHVGDRLGDGRVYRQIRGVEQERIRRRPHRARRRGRRRGRRGRGGRRAPPRSSAAPSSACRRAARASSEAVTKSLASASGQITVPMSRPSRTAPPSARAKRRWKSRSAARTAGSAATFEAACPARAERRSSRSRSAGVEPAGELGRPVRVDDAAAVVQRLDPHRAVEQAGVEVGEAEARRHRAADGALARGRRAVDRHGEFHRPDPRPGRHGCG